MHGIASADSKTGEAHRDSTFEGEKGSTNKSCEMGEALGHGSVWCSILRWGFSNAVAIHF